MVKAHTRDGAEACRINTKTTELDDFETMSSGISPALAATIIAMLVAEMTVIEATHTVLVEIAAVMRMRAGLEVTGAWAAVDTTITIHRSNSKAEAR